MHIVFNMWVLMDFGPEVEEVYGSARFFFIYVLTGIGGYLLSSLFGHFAIGGSGAILGVCGVVLAITTGRRDAAAEMLRSRVMRLLIYVAVLAILPFGFFGNIDNMAHIGGLATGFAVGKIMADRPPGSPEERNRANALGWATALVVIASVAFMMKGLIQSGS